MSKVAFDKVHETVEMLYSMDIPQSSWDVATAGIEFFIRECGWTVDEYWTQVMVQEQASEDQS